MALLRASQVALLCGSARPEHDRVLVCSTHASSSTQNMTGYLFVHLFVHLRSALAQVICVPAAVPRLFAFSLLAWQGCSLLAWQRSGEYPNGYMAVGYLMFLQEQIKDIIIIIIIIIARLTRTWLVVHLFVHLFVCSLFCSRAQCTRVPGSARTWLVTCLFRV